MRSSRCCTPRVTRARVKVIIYDSSTQKRCALLLLREAVGVAVELFGGWRGAGRRARSTPAEWAARARNLMENKLFEYASSCYEKAGDEVGMLRAMAYDLYQRAVGAGGRDAFAPAQPRLGGAAATTCCARREGFAQLPDGHAPRRAPPRCRDDVSTTGRLRPSARSASRRPRRARSRRRRLHGRGDAACRR